MKFNTVLFMAYIYQPSLKLTKALNLGTNFHSTCLKFWSVFFLSVDILLAINVSHKCLNKKNQWTSPKFVFIINIIATNQMNGKHLSGCQISQPFLLILKRDNLLQYLGRENEKYTNRSRIQQMTPRQVFFNISKLQNESIYCTN